MAARILGQPTTTKASMLYWNESLRILKSRTIVSFPSLFVILNHTVFQRLYALYARRISHQGSTYPSIIQQRTFSNTSSIQTILLLSKRVCISSRTKCSSLSDCLLICRTEYPSRIYLWNQLSDLNNFSPLCILRSTKQWLQSLHLSFWFPQWLFPFFFSLELEHLGHFFSHFENESYKLKLYDSCSIGFWLYIQVFYSKTAHTFFYLPEKNDELSELFSWLNLGSVSILCFVIP